MSISKYVNRSVIIIKANYLVSKKTKKLDSMYSSHTMEIYKFVHLRHKRSFYTFSFIKSIGMPMFTVHWYISFSFHTRTFKLQEDFWKTMFHSFSLTNMVRLYTDIKTITKLSFVLPPTWVTAAGSCRTDCPDYTRTAFDLVKVC